MSNKNLHAPGSSAKDANEMSKRIVELCEGEPAHVFSPESIQAIITRIDEIELSLAEIESVRREIAVFEQKINEFYKQEANHE